MPDRPYLEKLVEAVGVANHNYFRRRDQTKTTWEKLPPIYRETALASHREILLDGPAAIIDQALQEAWSQGFRAGRG